MECEYCGFTEFTLLVDSVLFDYQMDSSGDIDLICSFKVEEPSQNGIRKQCKECGHEEHIYEIEELGFSVET